MTYILDEFINLLDYTEKEIRYFWEGKWKFFFDDGKILSEENYKNGLLDGDLINYYPNGKMAYYGLGM